MKIKILGSGQEVGRSGILIKGDKNLVLDYGMKVEPRPPEFPMDDDVDGAVISHAHLDHSGGTPVLFKNTKPHVFMTDVTLELTAMLIKDSLKIARKEGYGLPYGKHDMKSMIKNTKVVTYRENFRFGDFNCSLYDSGHIPGSGSVMVENGKKIFYTADIQTIDTRLLNKCKLPDKVDTLIIESTYGTRVHEPRVKIENSMKEYVDEALARNETILIPTFAVGRAQEVLLILEQYADKIALDGMAKLATEIVSEYGGYLRSPEKLRSIVNKIMFVRSEEDRKIALKKKPIIVSSAGMMSGGPIIHYVKELSNRRQSKILFTGYLVDGTPGRALLETGKFKSDEDEFNVQCDLHRLDLSAHTDRRGIFEIIEKTKPERVICVHGDQCQQLAKDIESKFGIEAHAPANGEEISV